MSWTPSETNALIAVWGNERLTEARMQQLEVAGTVFSGKAPGPAMYERVSRALAELGYERTPSQCRERMKVNTKQNRVAGRNHRRAVVGSQTVLLQVGTPWGSHASNDTWQLCLHGYPWG